jgi:hypothetical protein
MDGRTTSDHCGRWWYDIHETSDQAIAVIL